MGQALRVENLSKDEILHEVSFAMEAGEMLAVMGPSGSGKSTLLYNVSGMDEPTSGRVWLGETELSELSEDERAQLRLEEVGFVFQQMNMLANLNVLDNIVLPATYAQGKVAKADLERHAKELMAKLSVAGLERRRITEVSGGQLQRACICRSMINDPRMLFADEPTGALNKQAAEEVVRELVGLNREGVSILMVTHDAKVASVCDRILYLLDGSICGELVLGKLEAGAGKRREDEVVAWLKQMGW